MRLVSLLLIFAPAALVASTIEWIADCLTRPKIRRAGQHHYFG